MRRELHFLVLVGLASAVPVGSVALAQSQTLAQTVGVYVFPGDGQDATQQSKDEAECYQAAVTNSGADPFALQREQDAIEDQTDAQVAAAQQAQGGGGAVRGAAAGAVVGELAGNDVGHSAAVGAAIGAVGNRRRNRKAREAEEQAAQQGESAAQATQQEIDSFKKSFSACLESKDYVANF